jgi:hypothetical protein
MNVPVTDDAEHLSRVPPRDAIHDSSCSYAKAGLWIEFGKL